MKVITSSPMPPEVQAYTLARYSRSADDFETSLKWVREKQNETGFLETYYFQYGHASIADLGNVTMSLEGISELAAIEVVDEQLWAGQQRSTRYQDFSKAEPVIPADLDHQQRQAYCDTFETLLRVYKVVHEEVMLYLCTTIRRPDGMNPEAYERNLNARAFDVARYLLPLGVPTNVGQVTSIRTLEKQIRRLGASRYPELQQLAAKMKQACANFPTVEWDRDSVIDYRVAPSLAKYVEPDEYEPMMRSDLRAWYEEVSKDRWHPLTHRSGASTVELFTAGKLLWAHGTKTYAPSYEVLATLLFQFLNESYEGILSFVCSLSHEQIQSGIQAALKSRGPHDELPRAFRNQPYTFEIVMDIGAYRDLHRHRRCQQFRQPYGIFHGYEKPDLIYKAGCEEIYTAAMTKARKAFELLSPYPGADYILPMGTRIRSLFKMDFAEVEYMCKLRSGVKGHFSYRDIAWKMYELMKKEEFYLGQALSATPSWEEAPLVR